MRVICISGKAQNGKDTLAKILNNELSHRGYRVLITHYGDLVKYICKAFFGWDGEKNEYGRYLMQYVGTDLVRQKRPSFWVDFVMSVLTMFQDKWDYVLIPDCRFPNELSCVSECGFPMCHIRIKRTNFTSPLTSTQQSHPSETSLDDTVPDILILNNGTLSDLASKASDIVSEIIADFGEDAEMEGA